MRIHHYSPACLGHFGLTAENYFLVPGIVLLAGGHGLIRSTVPVLSFFDFDFLFFRVINEEITSSVLLCKPIYQRHFYSNDLKNKPFAFFGISRGYFEKFIWHIYLHKQKQISCIFQCENEPYYGFCRQTTLNGKRPYNKLNQMIKYSIAGK